MKTLTVVILLVTTQLAVAKEVLLVNITAIERQAKRDFEEQLKTVQAGKRQQLIDDYRNGKEQRKVEAFWKWAVAAQPEPAEGRIPKIPVFVVKVLGPDTFIAKRDKPNFVSGEVIEYRAAQQRQVARDYGAMTTDPRGQMLLSRQLPVNQDYPALLFKGWPTKKIVMGRGRNFGAWYTLPASKIRVSYDSRDGAFIERVTATTKE